MIATFGLHFNIWQKWKNHHKYQIIVTTSPSLFVRVFPRYLCICSYIITFYCLKVKHPNKLTAGYCNCLWYHRGIILDYWTQFYYNWTKGIDHILVFLKTTDHWHSIICLLIVWFKALFKAQSDSSDLLPGSIKQIFIIQSVSFFYWSNCVECIKPFIKPRFKFSWFMSWTNIKCPTWYAILLLPCWLADWHRRTIEEPSVWNKPKMVNAPEGLNQVILEGGFNWKSDTFCPKRKFFWL